MLKKVLIVEDDAALRSSIEQTLDLEGYEPISTNGFTQARRMIRSNFRGIILSDIKMPDHDGFSVLEFVNARDPELPVVFLTGFSDVPTAIRAVKGGAYDYLEKPCDPVKLLEAVDRALTHRALVLENRGMREELSNTAQDLGQGTLAERLEYFERQIIESALADTGGKVAQAAEQLGIPQNTLYDRLSKLGIVAKAFRK